MKIIIILSILITVLLITTLVFAKLCSKYKFAYNCEHNKLVGLKSEYSVLIKAYNIRKNNKEKADEKINDLDSGVVSADDILPKRKG